ncbi:MULTISPECIES: PEGA domain-containing protein [unclassified Treponema]|uniref:PEGA domain-containing protein n=1 Tax=unclassified Treponema TaxID=2638727 RepID=UPI0020A46BFC|nr:MULTISPECIES: PEGA domain-containing protein [unclassified Treponema]UTC67730.1 PEGA domain-containing protein [Treponema sp. OMZ 789]UTC70458.1 PEGA domain-containing protein [Treponema sp. OMZ 790]
MIFSFRLKKISALFTLFFTGFLLFSQKAETPNSDWTIAVSEFKTEGLPSSYQSYKTIVPEMFLIYMDTGAKRIVPFEEKKIRAVMEASNKKLRLIKERAKLVSDKDNIFLSVEDKKTKDEKERKLKEEILKKEKEISDADIDIKIEDSRFFASGSPKNISLWKYGETLYNRNENSDLGESLKKENISALIYGSVKDISGYMVITAYLDTGLPGMKIHEFSGAGRYDDVEQVVKNISRQIYTIIQNTKEVKIFFDVNPKNAKVYIDSKLIRDFSKPITLREGSYQIGASAEGYVEETSKIELKGKSSYTLKISLKETESLKIGFNLKSATPDLFFKSRYSIKVPGIITLPKAKSILEFEEKGIHTFGIFEPSKEILSSQNVQNMIIKLNKKNVKDSIELQRKILYWSLGALYISLPITMILKAQLDDHIYAFRNRKLPYTQAEVDRINRFGITQNVFQGITIALGVNYFIQLIIYLVKADRALPRKIKPNYAEPVYPELKTGEDTTIKNEEKKNEE